MKIFFNTSVRGRNKYEENYQKIMRVLEQSGHELTTPAFVATVRDIRGETEEEARAYYKKLLVWIKQADILVFEVSYPSLGVGHEITMALQLNKPVIVLYVEGTKPFILDAIADDKLQVLEYDLGGLSGLLSDSLDYAAEQQDTRFNFFISPKHQNYLDWISKNRKLPRAVFLRRLIEKDMETNKEYKG